MTTGPSIEPTPDPGATCVPRLARGVVWSLLVAEMEQEQRDRERAGGRVLRYRAARTGPLHGLDRSA